MIKQIYGDMLEQTAVLDLVWRVFSGFEATDYSEEGIGEFQDSIAMDAMKRRLD